MGMFLVTDHGIHPSVVHGVKDVVQGFFRLPLEEKRASVGSYASIDNMGYGRSFVKSEDQALDWIDRLAMKAAPKGVDEGLLVWPQKPPNFSPHDFIQNFDPEWSEINVRVNYYPPCPQPELGLGITPHSDASGLSLLTQFGCSGGLQVLKGLNWETVPWPCDELLVNVGDLLEIMSDGRLKSPGIEWWPWRRSDFQLLCSIILLVQPRFNLFRMEMGVIRRLLWEIMCGIFMRLVLLWRSRLSPMQKKLDNMA
ncbi:Protein SRG1 [Vitis vinifera]|uniref:Protein SRG1 n=1 Tax=Vitis vinifera TaxID=29760 RepID=A0A438D796_VITVI|nr:Protein SRG1 [Vitis vinifera]